MYKYLHKIVAHRGAGIAAPENTLVSMEYGLHSGYSAVEFDVMLSKDELPVLLHDERLGRTVPGDCLCSELTREELTKLDAVKWHGGDFSHCRQHGRVPCFEEILDFCKANNIWMNVEIKPVEGFEQVTGTVVARYTKEAFQQELSNLKKLMAQYNYHALADALPRLPLMSSFSYEALMAAKQEAPELPRAYLIHDLSEVPDWKEQCYNIGAVCVHTCCEHLTPEQAKEIKALGYSLFCYTVNDASDWVRLKALGVDAMCTDMLDTFIGDIRGKEEAA
jgi:glycerophosphoryl diester phosphodiesterase